MFLILSGFGLTLSSGSARMDLRKFVRKRINRVFVPYWIITILILGLDFLLSQKKYHGSNIVMTFLGLNFAKEIRDLDYVRWFVTFILLWYTLFYFSNNVIRRNKKETAALLLGTGFILLPIDYYLLKIGWYQYLSFPLGCILGLYYKEISRFYSDNRTTLMIVSSIGIAYVICYHIIMSDPTIRNAILSTIPNILLHYFAEGNSNLLSLSLIVLFGYLGGRGFQSSFLGFLGRYSYELFLVHAFFLIKYNPFFLNPDSFYITSGFCILIILLAGVSMAIAKASKLFYVK
jgi:membrane-bound acyltransferase YfiQ involved in biofilm formation